jgi:hypothetical protein
MTRKVEKITVLAEPELAEEIEAARHRMASEVGLKASRSTAVAMLVRLGLDHVEKKGWTE